MKKIVIFCAAILMMLFTFNLAYSETLDVNLSKEFARAKLEAYERGIDKFKELQVKDKESTLKNYKLLKVTTKVEDYEKVYKEFLKTTTDNAIVYYYDNKSKMLYNNKGLKKYHYFPDQYQESGIASVGPETLSIASITAQDPGTINGAETGAFLRQTTYQGYKEIYGDYDLPSYSSFINQGVNGGTGYIYYGLQQYNINFDIEGGVQYNTGLHNYSGYIRINNGLPLDFDSNNNGVDDIRFEANHRVNTDLYYNSGNVNFVITGYNVQGANQTLIFTTLKTLTPSYTRVRRNTAIAKDAYSVSQDIGYMGVQYYNTTVKNSSGTSYLLSSSLLDPWYMNSKYYGTVEWPDTLITTSGTIDDQWVWIDTP